MSKYQILDSQSLSASHLSKWKWCFMNRAASPAHHSVAQELFPWNTVIFQNYFWCTSHFIIQNIKKMYTRVMKFNFKKLSFSSRIFLSKTSFWGLFGCFACLFVLLGRKWWRIDLGTTTLIHAIAPAVLFTIAFAPWVQMSARQNKANNVFVSLWT